VGGEISLTCWTQSIGLCELWGVKNPEKLSPWSFPSIGECASLLEAHGLEVNFAVLFDRATILEGGEHRLKLWLEMFGRFAIDAVAAEQRKEFFGLVDQFAGPSCERWGLFLLKRAIAV
jgi:hypothetical protein